MNVAALNDRVLVKPATADVRSAGGIVMASKPQSVPQQGIVIAVGPAVASDVQPGQRVLYALGKHETTTVEGMELLGLRDDDLMAVVEG